MLEKDPPKDLEPEQLFRLLLRPKAPILYRIRGAEDIPLEALPIRSLDYWQAVDEAKRVPEPLANLAFAGGVIAAALGSGGKRVFISADDLGSLADYEVYELYRALAPALSRISPLYGICNHMLWNEQLCLGALHPSNFHDVSLLTSSVDEGYRRVYPRPERYFGGLASDITDAQMMLFWAAYSTQQKNDG